MLATSERFSVVIGGVAMNKTAVDCYDIRSLFSQPPDLERCPECSQMLLRRSAHPSIAARAFALHATIPIIETVLISCPVCGWWAIREISCDCELNDGCTDLLLIPRGRPAQPAGEPWEQILEDRSSWQVSHPLTRNQARRLFGLTGWPKSTSRKHSKA